MTRPSHPPRPFIVDTETLFTEQAGEGAFSAKVSTAYQGLRPLVSVLYKLFPHRSELVVEALEVHDASATAENEGALLLEHILGRNDEMRLRLKKTSLRSSPALRRALGELQALTDSREEKTPEVARG